MYFDNIRLFSGDVPVDTGSPGPVDTGTTDTGVAFVGNQFTNPSFEDATNGWEVFPIGSGNFAPSVDGELIYGSSAVLGTYAGTGALKMYGAYTGGENITSIYQTFSDVPEGSTVTLNGWGLTHADDAIEGTTEAYLTVKFFDAGFGYLGGAASASIDATTPGTTWTALNAEAVVPAGTVFVQGVAEFGHCLGAGGAGSGLSLIHI